MKLQLEKATLPKLLNAFEHNIECINHSRAQMFKIVSIIDTRNLLAKKSNYNKTQLKLLASKGINEPWSQTTRTVLVGLYANFSWSQYVKFGAVSKQIDVDTAKRLSEDALIVLNRNRYTTDIKKISKKLKAVKGNITREMVEDIISVDKPKDKAPIKTTKKPVVNVKDSKDNKIEMLQNALEKSLDLNSKLNNEVKALRKRLRKYE